MPGVLKTSAIITYTTVVTISYDDATVKSLEVKQGDMITVGYYDPDANGIIQTITGMVQNIGVNASFQCDRLIIDASTQFASNVKTVQIDWIRALDALFIANPTS